jgi:3-methylcrotonyl-CoA carboxylase alpha subunit
MEMNTRLQVEHPVSEEITDTSLIELQFLTAAGMDTGLTQDDITPLGHSLEVRLYAEDALNNFMPSIGHIEHVEWPEDTRIDTGVKQGSHITPYYDAMMAKLITWGETRQEAISAMQESLSALRILGVKTNAAYLQKIISHPIFMNGQHTTHFLETEEAGLLSELKAIPASVFSLAVQHILTEREDALENKFFNMQDDTSPWNVCDGWRMNHDFTETFKFDSLDEVYSVLVTYKEDEVDIELPENAADDVFDFVGGDVLSENDGIMNVFVNGLNYELKLINGSENISVLETDVESSFTATMPGVLTKVLTRKGQKVKKGDTLLVMEAMKMEQSFRAPKDGVVSDLFFKEGEQVALGAQLLSLE